MNLSIKISMKTNDAMRTASAKGQRLVRRAPAMFAAALTLAACTSTPPILPQRDFDRPTDVTFVCMGASFDDAPPNADADGGTPLVLSGLPMRWCHPRNATDPAPDVRHRTFAFLPNSNSGQLGVVDADNWKLVDLDPQIAGFNQAPLGVLPEQIVSSDDGCRVVTVNHGSCDLSLVDPAALMASTLHAAYPEVPASTGNPIFTRVQPHTASGRALPRAGELAFIPQATDLDPQVVHHLCRASWTGQAIMTFPSCHLVALVDLPSGEVRDSYRVHSDGNGSVRVEPAGREPACEVSVCGAPLAPTSDAGPSSDARDDTASSDDAPDASAADVIDATASSDADASDAMTVAADAADAAEAGVAGPDSPPISNELEPHPSALAVSPSKKRVYVGLSDAPVVLGFDFSSTSLQPAGGVGNQGLIPLAEGAVGANRLRLSLDPYLDNPSADQGKTAVAGTFIGDSAPTVDPFGPQSVARDYPARQYLYVVARDGSVRVVQVFSGVESECETNVDPGATNLMGAQLDDACVPVNKSYRRATAVGPGIRLPSPPVDVAVADIGSGTDNSETSIGGTFAWVLTANGSVNLVDINPVWRATSYYKPDGTVLSCVAANHADCHPEVLPPPNTLRDRNVLSYTPALDTSSGPARLDFAPAVAITGPRLQNLWTRGTDDNAAAYSSSYIRTGVFFPKDAQPAAQTWSVTWEGSLGAPRFSGQIVLRPADGKATTALLQDFGMDFCRAGLRPSDLVTVRGCLDDTECGLGKVCVHGTDGVQGAGSLLIGGLCLPMNTAPERCGQLLNTVRRYDAEPLLATQTALTSNQVQLAPHKDELVLPSMVHCHDAETGIDGGADASATGDASTDTSAPGDASVTTDGGAPGATSRTDLSSSCVNAADPSTSRFRCIDDRCLQPCDHAGQTSECRAGRTCVRFPAGNPNVPDTAPCGKNECFCSDGPDLTKVDAATCLGELLPYQLSVAGGYLVAGSQSGIPITQVADAHGMCAPIPNIDPRRVDRISLRTTPWCDADHDEPYDGRCNPNVYQDGVAVPAECQHPDDPRMATSKNDWDLLVSLVRTSTDANNPCLFLGGANDSDPLASRSPRHVQAVFRNEQIQFLLTNLEQPLSDALQIRFDVSGGFLAQTVGLPNTVEIGMPARIVVGPFDSQTSTISQAAGSLQSRDVPYLFVVDQRRLGRAQGSSATRGQLLRIHPRGNAITTPKVGYQPLYEDLNRSVNLFPIQ